MQNQLQMISPINDNHQHEEIIIKSPEVKTKIVKPTVLIPIPEADNVGELSATNNLFKRFFSGKEKKNETVLDTSLITVIAEQSELVEHNLTSPSLVIKNKLNDNIKSHEYNITSNKPLSLETTELSTTVGGHKISKENISDRKKRSFEIFFNSNVQVSGLCIRSL